MHFLTSTAITTLEKAFTRFIPPLEGIYVCSRLGLASDGDWVMGFWV